MSDLRLDTYVMPAANLGSASPLVPFWYDTADLVAPRPPGNELTQDDVKYYGYGYHHGCLPYFTQNNFDRARMPRGFKAAVLENDILRTTFLLELGGRLWSLYHKPTKRELLHVNPVFQPANLGLRNAWISGGVEWNFCWIGHTPFTVSPLFAGKAQLDDGTPVLRMWEFERVRQMAYQIDTWLPDGSPVLFVRVRLVNLDDRTVPIYWWSNIAVPERQDVRVIAPATCSHQVAEKEIQLHTYPCYEGRDYSYPTNASGSGDRFYRIEPRQYPWIASVDGDGQGRFQSSTARLVGRKLWVFGQNAGGRMWQDFLNTPGHPYIEIQAGLARTQGECVPLPPKTEWEWLEAYGSVQTDPKLVHGKDWTAAWQETQRSINTSITFEKIEQELQKTRGMAQKPVKEIWQTASGWGALENARRAKADQPSNIPASLMFPQETMDPEQAPWLELLNKGVLPETPVEQIPVSWMIQDEWREMLEKAVGPAAERLRRSDDSMAADDAAMAPEQSVAPSDHWQAWLHLGVMYLGGQWDLAKARKAWETSVARKPNAWAYRMLAALATHQKNPALAAELYPKAVTLAPDNLRIVIECGKSLVEAGKAREWLKIVDTLPASVRAHGHVKIFEAMAATALDDLGRAGRVLAEPFELAEVREGETLSVQAWFTYQEKRIAKAEGIAVDETLKQRVRKECPPPKHLDFRL